MRRHAGQHQRAGDADPDQDRIEQFQGQAGVGQEIDEPAASRAIGVKSRTTNSPAVIVPQSRHAVPPRRALELPQARPSP